jgi:hypothetical protein
MSQKMVLLKKFWQAYKASEMPETNQVKVGAITMVLFVIFAIIGFFIGVFSPLSIEAGIECSEIVLIIIYIAFRIFYITCQLHSAFTEVFHKAE